MFALSRLAAPQRYVISTDPAGHGLSRIRKGLFSLHGWRGPLLLLLLLLRQGPVGEGV